MSLRHTKEHCFLEDFLKLCSCLAVSTPVSYEATDLVAKAHAINKEVIVGYSASFHIVHVLTQSHCGRHL